MARISNWLDRAFSLLNKPFSSAATRLGAIAIKKLFEGWLMVITVSHGQVDKKCGVFALWHLCFLRGGPRVH